MEREAVGETRSPVLGETLHTQHRRGDQYGSGHWQDLYKKALATGDVTAPKGDPVRGRFPPDLLRTNRGKIRKPFADIDRRFRGELKRIQAAEDAAGAG